MGILVLILEEMLSAFYCWAWCQLWICHVYPLLCWGMFPLYSLWEFLIMNDEVVNGEFYASIEMIIWFLFSFLILEWTVSWLIIGSSVEVMMWFLFSFLIDFKMLNHSCILGILANPTWSWCMILLMLLIQFANILLRIFCICVHPWYWPVLSFFVCGISGFHIGMMLPS